MILICKNCKEEFSCIRYSMAKELKLCFNCYLLNNKYKLNEEKNND